MSQGFVWNFHECALHKLRALHKQTVLVGRLQLGILLLHIELLYSLPN